MLLLATYDLAHSDRLVLQPVCFSCKMPSAVMLQVGGLSVINAIAGAYSENLPVICIVGKEGSPHAVCTHFAPQSLIMCSHDRGSKLQ